MGEGVLNLLPNQKGSCSVVELVANICTKAIQFSRKPIHFYNKPDIVNWNRRFY